MSHLFEAVQGFVEFPAFSFAFLIYIADVNVVVESSLKVGCYYITLQNLPSSVKSHDEDFFECLRAHHLGVSVFRVIVNLIHLRKSSCDFSVFVFFDCAIGFSFNHVYLFCVYNLYSFGYRIFANLGEHPVFF